MCLSKGEGCEKYSIPQLDLSTLPGGIEEKFNYLYDLAVVDNNGTYLGHPDSVLLANGDILTVYPAGHGKGAVLSKISSDGGLTYDRGIENPPQSWKNSRETPTVYRLCFADKAVHDKLVMICGNPKWGVEPTTGGFNCSFSDDEGASWSEFELFFPGKLQPIVAMSSLTQLKENGCFVDRWMGLFHDRHFFNYKSILSFGTDGKPQWSVPERYFSQWRKIERESNMCEVECIRSGGGTGDELCIITRSNSKKMNSLISFSSDEGKTWSKPVEAPAALNGERHKADYLKDGRLFITFRSIERDSAGVRAAHTGKGWYSEGWVAWVGTYGDLKNARQGEYRIKLAHTYLDGQSEPCFSANADTGYCGNVVLTDGTVVTSTYGRFSKPSVDQNGQHIDAGKVTFVVSKRINPADTDILIRKACDK